MKLLPRGIAAIVTAITAIVVIILLLVLSLSVPATPERHGQPVAEVAEADEEYVELLDLTFGPSQPAAANAPVTSHADLRPAAAGGDARADIGKVAPPPAVKTQSRPSKTIVPERPQLPQAGPDRKQQEQDEARRRARDGVGAAFAADNDKVSDHGKDRDQSGSEDGVSGGTSGSGNGTVGGGWIMPRYDVVPSEVTGSIVLSATVDATGHVVSVELTGGKSPAAANRALVQACIAEVRRHTFSRNDDNAPERSTARITYTFR